MTDDAGHVLQPFAAAPLISQLTFAPPLKRAHLKTTLIVTTKYDPPTIVEHLVLEVKKEGKKGTKPVDIWLVYFAKEHSPINLVVSLTEITDGMFGNKGRLPHKPIEHSLYLQFYRDDEPDEVNHPITVVRYSNELQTADGTKVGLDSNTGKAIRSYVDAAMNLIAARWNSQHPDMQDAWGTLGPDSKARAAAIESGEKIHWRVMR